MNEPRRTGVRSKPDRQFVTALARGLAILRCYTRRDRSLGNAEIAARTRLPRPTVSRLTHTLTRLGYLDYLPAEQRYALSAGVLAIGHAYLATMDVREVARPHMQALADHARATVSLGAADPSDETHMIYLEICQGAGQMFHMRMEVGAHVPHGTTAMGRAYLAALSPETRAVHLERYRKVTPRENWESLRAGIEKAARDYEKYGFCLSLGDWNRDVWAVGVPMLSGDGGRVLAFNCSGPIFDMTRQRLTHDIGPRLMQLRDRVLEGTGGNF